MLLYTHESSCACSSRPYPVWTRYLNRAITEGGHDLVSIIIIIIFSITLLVVIIVLNIIGHDLGLIIIILLISVTITIIIIITIIDLAALDQVRKTISWPRRCANSSLLQLYSHRSALADLHYRGQPNTLLASVRRQIDQQVYL